MSLYIYSVLGIMCLLIHICCVFLSNRLAIVSNNSAFKPQKSENRRTKSSYHSEEQLLTSQRSLNFPHKSLLPPQPLTSHPSMGHRLRPAGYPHTYLFCFFASMIQKGRDGLAFMNLTVMQIYLL